MRMKRNILLPAKALLLLVVGLIVPFITTKAQSDIDLEKYKPKQLITKYEIIGGLGYVSVLHDHTATYVGGGGSYIVNSSESKYPNVKIILTGMMVPPNMGKEYADGFKKIYPELAAKNRVPLYPFLLEGVAGNEKLNQADGIHPNPEGHQIIAKKLAAFLKDKL